jgi:alkylated DNA nucleotide flippase Atl1
MGLFKSKDERRIEREMKIRGGMRSIERSIRQQEKFAEDFIKNAQHAKKIGDDGQYQFIRSALKKTASVKKMLERQLLSIRNAMLISQQAQASQQFAESMALMAREIGQVFGQLDLTKTQADWERAVNQAGSIEQRMDLFLDSMEQSATAGQSTSTREDLVTDEEIDRMINTDVLAGEKAELGKLDELESEIAKELGTTKQKD